MFAWRPHIRNPRRWVKNLAAVLTYLASAGILCWLWPWQPRSTLVSTDALNVRPIASSPDGRVFVSHDSIYFGTSRTSLDFRDVRYRLQFWDLESGQPLYEIPTSGNLERSTAKFSSDSRYLAIAEVHMLDTENYRGSLHVFDVSNRSHIVVPVERLQSCVGYCFNFAFSPDGKMLAYVEAVAGGEILHLWDMATERIRLRLPTNVGRAWAISPDNKLIAASGPEIANEPPPEQNERYVNLFDVTSGQLIRKVGIGPRASIQRLRFAPDGQCLIGELLENPSGGSLPEDIKEVVRIWDLATGTQQAFWSNARFPAVCGTGRVMALRHNTVGGSHRVSVHSLDGRKLTDLRLPKEVHQRGGEVRLVQSVADRHLVAVAWTREYGPNPLLAKVGEWVGLDSLRRGGMTGGLAFYDTNTGQRLGDAPVFRDWHQFRDWHEFSRDGRTLATFDPEDRRRTITFWDVPPRRIPWFIFLFPFGPAAFVALAWRQCSCPPGFARKRTLSPLRH